MIDEQLAGMRSLLDRLDGAVLTDTLQARIFANSRALLDEVNRLREFISEFEDDYTAALNDHGEELSGLLRKLEKETGSLP